jgi:predicted aspartyl protease
VKVTRFDPTADLMIVPGRIWGPRGEGPRLNMVVDTGSAETVVIPEVLDELGYSARTADRITVMRSAVGREEGYLIRVQRFASLGFQFSDFQIHAHDLPEGWGIHGLLGLTFLRHFNCEIRLREGRLLIDRADEEPS